METKPELEPTSEPQPLTNLERYTQELIQAAMDLSAKHNLSSREQTLGLQQVGKLFITASFDSTLATISSFERLLAKFQTGINEEQEKLQEDNGAVFDFVENNSNITFDSLPETTGETA